MAGPLNALEIAQAWDAQQTRRMAIEEEMRMNQALLPYRMRAMEANALRDTAAIEQSRNALAFQRQQAQEQNLLRREAIASRERTMANMLARKPMPRPQVVQTETGPMMLDASTGRASPIIGPDGQPVKPKSLEKALPTSAAQKLMENNQNLRRAEQALALMEGRNVMDIQGITVASGDKDATGKKGFLTYMGDPGNYLLNALDPSGVDTRAAVADLGSLIIHDRSGAAVTAAEYPRLRPFIPQATDAPDVAKKKLKRFVTEYQNVVGEAADFYKESGYKVPESALRSGGAAPKGGAANDPLGMR